MTRTPAQELQAAAEKLGKLAAVAQEELDTGEYWAFYNKATAWRDGFTNGFGGVSSELVALFTPTTARELSRWLQSAARDASEIGPDPHALAVARLINAASPS